MGFVKGLVVVLFGFPGLLGFSDGIEVIDGVVVDVLFGFPGLFGLSGFPGFVGLGGIVIWISGVTGGLVGFPGLPGFVGLTVSISSV